MTRGIRTTPARLDPVGSSLEHSGLSHASNARKAKERPGITAVMGVDYRFPRGVHQFPHKVIIWGEASVQRLDSA
jgi:hypothetical protein